MLQQMRSLAKYVWVLVALAFVGGFLLYQTSGLMGRTPVTSTTPVAVVNGQEILYTDWVNRYQTEIQNEQQRQGGGRTLSCTKYLVPRWATGVGISAWRFGGALLPITKRHLWTPVGTSKPPLRI